MSTISEMSSGGSQHRQNEESTNMSLSRGMSLSKSSCDKDETNRYGAGESMSAVREKSKLTSLLDDLSIESSAAVRTPRERSCDEVLKYSVIGKLDVEKTRMRVQNELAIMTERKPAKLYRDIASAAPSISRRA